MSQGQSEPWYRHTVPHGLDRSSYNPPCPCEVGKVVILHVLTLLLNATAAKSQGNKTLCACIHEYVPQTYHKVCSIQRIPVLRAAPSDAMGPHDFEGSRSLSAMVVKRRSGLVMVGTYSSHRHEYQSQGASDHVGQKGLETLSNHPNLARAIADTARSSVGALSWLQSIGVNM